MKQWVGNAHGDQSARCAMEKRVGRFDSRDGGDSLFVLPARWQQRGTSLVIDHRHLSFPLAPQVVVGN